MKKILILLLILSSALTFYAQDETPPAGKTCLFGYISDNSQEFESVIRYLGEINIEVLGTCPQEHLIFVRLNKKLKEYTQLFDRIEADFPGTCYYKSDINRIPEYDNCEEQYIKQNTGIIEN